MHIFLFLRCCLNVPNQQFAFKKSPSQMKIDEEHLLRETARGVLFTDFEKRHLLSLILLFVKKKFHFMLNVDILSYQ